MGWVEAGVVRLGRPKGRGNRTTRGDGKRKSNIGTSKLEMGKGKEKREKRKKRHGVKGRRGKRANEG